MRILVIEDHDETRRMILRVLRQAGYLADGADRLHHARRRMEVNSYGAMVLDWMLPDGSGPEFCREVRGRGDIIQILMLTALDDIGDRVEGLDSGADDYMRKPFAVAELLARVRALRRRGPHLLDPVVRLGALEVRPAERRVFAGGREIPLTNREFIILEILLRRRGHVVPRRDILRVAWADGSPGGEASMEVLIARLRRKLTSAGRENPIRTHRGFGYSIGTQGEH